MFRFATNLLGLAAVFCTFAAAPSGAATFLAAEAPRRDFPDVDGTVHAILFTNGTVYVGGSFSYSAPHGPKVLSLDYLTAVADRSFPAILGTAIHALIEDGNGGWFVGGDFNEAGGVAMTNLAHVLADGSVDPAFALAPNGAVRALARVGGTLYVGGDFTSILNQPRGRGAAFDLESQQLLAWNPLANERIVALAANETVVVAGGYFTQIGGQSRGRIAALDPVTAAPGGFNPNADGAVLSLDLAEDRVFLAGFFNLVGGQARNGVAAVELAAGTVLPWNPNPQGGKATCVRANCDTVYVGGYFTNLAGAPRMRVGAVDFNSATATSWNPGLGALDVNGAPSYVLALALAGDRVYIGGQFASVGGLARRDLVAVDARTASLLSWNPGVNGGVSALALAGERVLAGFVVSPGGATRRNLAAFDEVTGRLLAWAPTTDGPVLAFAYAQGYLFAAGSFNMVNGVVHPRLAALDAQSGALAATWTVTADNTISALAATDDVLYLGGSFSEINDVARSRLAAVFVGNALLLDNWDPGADGAVDALRLSDRGLYVGGSFSAVAGQTRRNLAALDPASGAALPWNPNANGRVRTLATSTDMVFAGGDFTSVSSLPRLRLAAINATNGALSAWAPAADAEVRALAWAGDRVYVGGSFLTIDNQPRRGLAAVSENGLLLPWNPGRSSSNRVNALVLGSTSLLVGGPLGLGLEGSPEVHALAAFAQVGAPVITQPPVDLKVSPGTTAVFSVMAGGQAPLFYQWQFQGVDIPGATASTLAIGNAQLPNGGTYSVLVQNALGVARADATLLILVPVAISTVTSNIVTSNGATVTLTVAATGNPPPAYQWRLNGANIPGAVNAALTISNAQPRDGGTYDVVAANETGAVESSPIMVRIPAVTLPFADDFAGRGTISSAAGVGSTDNFLASLESNEPVHAGKVGGRSVWIRWRPPLTGVATLSTRGSSFDTLLAVYNGNDFVTNFTLVASSEDQAGFNNSTVTFNATADLAYQIAIDGYAGTEGDIVLSWSVTANNTEFPRIIAQPASRSVSLGAAAAFTVLATSATPLRFQWFFGCRALPGETNATLTLPSVQPRHVGAYHVVVMNASSQAAFSEDAFLEIGPASSLVAREKAGDLFLPLSPGTNNPAPPPLALAQVSVGPTAFIPVSVGTLGSQALNNTGAATSPGEPVHCQVLGGHSKWFGVQAQGNATFQIDTLGSAIDTVLAVYTQADLFAPLGLVTCDNNGAPDRLRSVVRFPTQSGQQYLIAVDGVNGAQGAIRLNWNLGLPPHVSSLSPSNQMVLRGDRVTLAIAVSNTNPPAAYQWRLNGLVLAGANRASLTLSNLQGPQSGQYSVVVSNFAGMVTSKVSFVMVDVPLNVERPVRTTNGACRFTVVGNPGQQFVTLHSTDLVSWNPIRTNTLSGWETNHTDATIGPRRFFRVTPFPPAQ